MNGDGKYYKSFILLFKTASSLAEVQCHSNQAAEMAMVKLMMIMRRMLERKGDYIGEMRKRKAGSTNSTNNHYYCEKIEQSAQLIKLAGGK